MSISIRLLVGDESTLKGFINLLGRLGPKTGRGIHERRSRSPEYRARTQ